MGDSRSRLMATPSPPPPSDWKSRFNPLYYGIIVVASTAVLLMVYNLVVMGWCWQRRHNTMLRRPTGSSTGDSGSGVQFLNRELIPATMYQKEGAHEQSSNNECAVCLSVFVDGEELRQLPQCKHSFHAACIDMWLHSHSNCPLCRATVVLPSRNLTHGEDFRQGSPDFGSLV